MSKKNWKNLKIGNKTCGSSLIYELKEWRWQIAQNSSNNMTRPKNSTWFHFSLNFIRGFKMNRKSKRISASLKKASRISEKLWGIFSSRRILEKMTFLSNYWLPKIAQIDRKFILMRFATCFLWMIKRLFSIKLTTMKLTSILRLPRLIETMNWSLKSWT